MKLLLAATLALFTLGPRPALADMAATFDMDALHLASGAPCSAQASMRHGNILAPHFPGRPEPFLNPKESLVIYSPALTLTERAQAQQLYDSIPKYALPMAWRGGAVYVFVRRGMVEAVPALATQADWFADYGLYMQVERRMYVPFEKGEGMRWNSAKGRLEAAHWEPTSRDLFRVVNHETGHMVDEMLGLYSTDSHGEDGEYRLSNRPDYRAAQRRDLARLASPAARPIPIERIHKLGYYMPKYFDHVRLGIQDDQRARREVFAELWAEVQGYNLNKLYEAYPDSFEVVKQYAAFLKSVDEKASVHCDRGDGR